MTVNHKQKFAVKSKAPHFVNGQVWTIWGFSFLNIGTEMFFWFGFDLFDSRKKEYGGFNHFIAGKIFRWKYCYLTFSLRMQWRFEWIHEDEEYYYDGFHNAITIGCFQISYGT